MNLEKGGSRERRLRKSPPPPPTNGPQNSPQVEPPLEVRSATPSPSAYYIVGIGASAGGLEALRTLFGALKTLDRTSIVVVQHLAPQHRSRLTEILGHATHLEVKEVTEGIIPMPNTIYITPPNSDVILEAGALRLEEPEARIGPKPSIDRFLRSLAEEIGENAIGIVLSGTGSDGAKGIRTVKACGGVTMCQTIDSSKYDGMPRAAKQTGTIDLELPPEEIAHQLLRFNELAGKIDRCELQAQLHPTSSEPHKIIFQALEQVSKVHFENYKQTTIQRRIQRRIVATRCENVTEYAAFIQKNPEEVRMLFQDILISVTSFLRDERSFLALQPMISQRIRAKDTGQHFRAWVVGCATGEEVYTLAILILEAIEKSGKQVGVQVFATDIDERAMACARKGIYSRDDLSEFPTKLRAKYFDEANNYFKVKDYVRDCVVFARHDVTQDPPFLKLDLVSCRNVLIYFNAGLQEQTLKAFHFALDQKGILFLGKSEATSAVGNLFAVANKNAKIWMRSSRKGEVPKSFGRSETSREAVLVDKDRSALALSDLLDSVVNGFAPDCILIDSQYKVRHVFGNANCHLNFPKGKPTESLPKLLSQDIALELTALLHRAQKSQRSVCGNHPYHYFDEKEKKQIQLSVVPLTYDGRTEYLVCFVPVAAAQRRQEPLPEFSDKLSAEERVRVLHQELIAAREHLQTVVEEHETANEELQALNEELQSTNEELQSTNEELETTNEELQSANEELTTMNQEMNVKSSELATLYQRYQAILSVMYYPLLMIDPSMRLTDFNPASRFLLRLTDADRGQNIKSINFPYDIKSIIELTSKSLEEQRDGRMDFRLADRAFEVRTQVFRGSKDEIDGLVISFFENTELVAAYQDANINRERFSSILENTPALVTLKDLSGTYVYSNSRFCSLIGIPQEAILGKTDEELFGEEISERFREQDFEVLKTRSFFITEESIPLKGASRYWLSSKFPLLDNRRKAQFVCSISLDITEKILREQQLDMFKRSVSASKFGIVVFTQQDGDFFVSVTSDQCAEFLKCETRELKDLSLAAFLKILLRNTRSIDAEGLATRAKSGEALNEIINLREIQDCESWVELKTSAMNFGSPPNQNIVFTFADINERVRAQRIVDTHKEESAKFSKLASLGEVAAGISHEINTPLNVITTKVNLIRRLSEKKKLDVEYVLGSAKEIENMVENIANVISGLKSLAGLDAEELRVHPLTSLIQEAIKICDFRIQRFAVKLILESENDLKIQCFPIQIVQILINLINNAIDAVCDLRERWIRIEVTESGGKALVRVIDSGKGISPDIAERIMTPFFTTKRNRRGTGLGLSLSRSIARHHHGDLILEVNRDNTSFRLELPLGGDH